MSTGTNWHCVLLNELWTLMCFQEMWELGWKNKARPQRTFFLPVLTVTLCMHVYVWMTPGLKAVSVWSIWQSSNSAVTLINIWVQMYTTHCQLLIEVTQLNHSYIHSQQMKLFEIFSLLLVFHCHNGNYCLAGRQNPWNINWETDEDRFKAQIDNWIILKNPVFSGYSRDLLKDLKGTPLLEFFKSKNYISISISKH